MKGRTGKRVKRSGRRPRVWCAPVAAALLWLIAAAPCVAGLDRGERESLYEEGKRLFREANELSVQDAEAARDLYLKAALRFERIAREGPVRNGKLYYNIGNAYFRMRDIGRAILNYRRAERYIPRDANLATNLAAARARRKDAFEPGETARVFRAPGGAIGEPGLRRRFRGFAGAFALFWLLAAVRSFAPRAAPAGVLAVVALVAAWLGGTVALETARLARERPGVILAEQTIARQGDGENYEPSFKEPLHAGAEFRLLERRGAWCWVELPDASRCWLAARDVEMVDGGAPKP